MASRVVLDIIPRCIQPLAWAEAYDETATLLAAHPARLLGHGFRTVAGVRVPVLTRAVEQGEPGTTDRRWCVAGDKASLGTGERQRMYRDLDRYAVHDGSASARPAEPPIPDEILAVMAGDGTATSPLVRVFGEGDQTEPCQLALLTAAMVVETRFPMHAIVSGNLDRERCEAARRWAKSVLGQTLALPVRLFRFRLVERLRPHLEGDALANAVDRLHISDAPPTPRTAGDGETRGRSALDALAGLTSPAELDAEQRGRIQAVATAAKEARRALDDLGGPPSAGTARPAIANLLALRGPTLTEDAWDWIEREEDPALVGLVAGLAALEPTDPETGALRRVLLENRALCRYAAG